MKHLPFGPNRAVVVVIYGFIVIIVAIVYGHKSLTYMILWNNGQLSVVIMHMIIYDLF